MELSFSNDWVPLINATFQGYVNLGGTQFKNVDVNRDRCELHLHRYTGMVLMKYNNAQFMVAANCVQAVEWDPQLTREIEPPSEEEMLKMAGESIQRQDAEQSTPEASDDAETDAILAELGHVAPKLSDSSQPKRQKRQKRSE